MIVISKADLVDDEGMARVEAIIGAHAREGVKNIHSRNGDVSAAILLGLASVAEDDLDSRKAAHDHHHDHDDDHDDHDHDHDHHHDHHHDEFHSIVVPPRVFASMDDVKACVEKALAQPGILRVKGYVALEGKKARVVVQAVGRRVDSWFDTSGEAKTGLVVIGLKDFDQAAAEATLS